jgi:micrococcal nuclease
MKKILVYICMLFTVVSFSSHQSAAAEDLTSKLKGRILLQVESRGEAWYVNPRDGKRYYMANGYEAYNVMRTLGVGITTLDLDKIKSNSIFAKKHSGKIFLQVQGLGEAFYIDINGSAHYLKDGESAYQIMRKLGLGIRTSDLSKIELSAKDKQNNSLVTYYEVAEVVDGDTIKVVLNGATTTIRLIGLDTPETLDPRKVVQCFGREASSRAGELLLGKMVRLENDGAAEEVDKYFRLLKYVYLEDGTLYNDKMIRDGYAHEYTYNKPYKYQAQFKEAQNEASSNLRGLWAPDTCNGDTTQESVGNDEVVNTITNKQYYTSSYHTSKYYYPSNCDGWRSLASNYLQVFDSLDELLKKYPSRVVSSTCH